MSFPQSIPTEGRSRSGNYGTHEPVRVNVEVDGVVSGWRRQLHTWFGPNPAIHSTGTKIHLLSLALVVIAVLVGTHLVALYYVNSFQTIDSFVSAIAAIATQVPVFLYLKHSLNTLGITVRKLQSAEQTLSGLREMSNEAVMTFDSNYRVLSFGKGAEGIFGWTEKEILGQPVSLLMPQRFHAAHSEHVQGFSASSQQTRAMSKRREIIGIRKSGDEFPAQASIAKLTNPHDREFVVILRDISQERALNTELNSAKLAAEAANDAKSRFIANMNHELRTPLNAIIGFSSMISEQLFGPIGKPKYIEYANDIYKSGQHLLSLVNTILDMSRLDSVTISVSDDICSANEIARECVKTVQGMAQEAGITVHGAIPKCEINLLADGRMLKQILLNLLSNAVKFSPKGGRISLGITATEKDGVLFCVSDTGIGMSPSDITRIGQPFVQIDNRLARKYEGSGLGLAITKRLVDLHGGTLAFESELGKGTTVTVVLPPSRVQPPQAQPVLGNIISEERQNIGLIAATNEARI